MRINCKQSGVSFQRNYFIRNIFTGACFAAIVSVADALYGVAMTITGAASVVNTSGTRSHWKKGHI